jgi:hypothetical protein
VLYELRIIKLDLDIYSLSLNNKSKHSEFFIIDRGYLDVIRKNFIGLALTDNDEPCFVLDLNFIVLIFFLLTEINIADCLYFDKNLF